MSFLRLKQAEEYTCLSKSSICLLMEEEIFPKQVPLGAYSVVWVKSHVKEGSMIKLIRETQEYINKKE